MIYNQTYPERENIYAFFNNTLQCAAENRSISTRNE